MCTHLNVYVVRLMKMGSILSRAGIEPTYLTFRGSVLTITPCRPPDIRTLALPVYANACLRSQCRLLQLVPLGIAYNYIHKGNGHTYKQGRFNNHTAHSFYGIMVMEPVWWGGGGARVKTGNVAPRSGIETTSFAL